MAFLVIGICQPSPSPTRRVRDAFGGIRESVQVGDSSFAFPSFARAEAQKARVPLRQLDPGSTGAVQQSLEMEADQPVVRPHPDEGREGRHGRRVTSHQLGEGLRVSFGRRLRINLRSERLQRTQRVSPAAQYQVPDHAAFEVWNAAHNRLADANARAELFIGALQARSYVDRIAIGCVVEKSAAAEIADGGDTSMDANARLAERNVLLPPALAKILREAIEVQRTCNCPAGMIGLIAGRSKQYMQRISDDLGDRSFVTKDNIRGPAEIFIEERRQFIRLD